MVKVKKILDRTKPGNGNRSGSVSASKIAGKKTSKLTISDENLVQAFNIKSGNIKKPVKGKKTPKLTISDENLVQAFNIKSGNIKKPVKCKKTPKLTVDAENLVQVSSNKTEKIKKVGKKTSKLAAGDENSVLNIKSGNIKKPVKGKKTPMLTVDAENLVQVSNNKTEKIKKAVKGKTPKPTASNDNIPLNVKSKNIKKAVKGKKAPKLTVSNENLVEISNNKTVNVKKIAKSKTTPKLAPNDENLEHLFDVKSEDIKKAVEGVIKFQTDNPKLQKQLFQERTPLFLQICCHKIPTGHSKILRIPLPNSFVTPDDEICLIVPEVKGIKNIEHEKHEEHYEELLAKKGVNNLKKIMTFHEFRTEHETFEQKSRLVDLYDIFLVDGRISGKVVHKCGKIFYKKRKVPTPVKLHVTKLKDHIEKSLSKAFCHLHLKGDSFIVQFGHNKMDVDDLVQNIFSVMEFLRKQFPGGLGNVKGVQVFTKRAPSVPIYMSFKAPYEIKAPKMKLKKPKAYKTYEDELSTLPNANVTVRPSGKVLITRTEEDDAITSK